MSERSAEQDEVLRLRAEVEHWKTHAEEAGAGFSQVCLDYARVAARNSELVRRVEALADEYDRSENWRIWGVPQSIRRVLAELSTPPETGSPT